MQSGVTAGINQDLRDLIAAVSEAVHTPVLALTVEELGERVCLAQQLRSIADAAIVAATMAAEDRAVGPNHGLRTTSQYVAANTNVDAASVGRDVALGRWLRSFHGFEEAFNAGVLKRAHLGRLREIDNSRTRHDLVRDQQILIDAARDCSYSDFAKAVSYWLIANDPDGAEPKEQLAKTGLTYRQSADGSVDGKFYFDPLAAAVFKQALGVEVEKLHRSDADTEVTRSTRQLNAAGLILLFTKGSRRADGTFPAPLINLVMSLKVAEDTITRLDEPSDEPLPVSIDDPDERCELIDGTPIHPYFALAAMSVGRFQRHVFDSENRRINQSSPSRTFPQWMKQIFLIESRGRCQTRGCDAPFQWLQADHIVPASKHGPTALDNGEMRCAPDNMAKGDRHPGEDYDGLAA